MRYCRKRTCLMIEHKTFADRNDPLSETIENLKIENNDDDPLSNNLFHSPSHDQFFFSDMWIAKAHNTCPLG